MQNSEKYYIYLLENHRAIYLSSSNDSSLKPYIENLDKIICFHKEIFYPALKKSDFDISEICELFTKCVKVLIIFFINLIIFFHKLYFVLGRSV